MKSFLEKSKRALVLLLTGAMIATSVPSTILAAPLATDEDVIFEEGADAVEALGVAEEELVVEEAVDPVEPDAYAGDALITTGAVVDPDTTHYTYATVDTVGFATTVSANDASSYLFDSDNGWSFYVVPKVGYTLPKASGSFDTAKFVKISGSYTYTSETKVDLSASDYTVEASNITDATGLTSATYDWSAAAKITFTGGTTFMNSFKNVKDGTKTCSQGPIIKIEKPDTPTNATANKFVIDIKGNTKNIGVINGTFDTKFLAGTSDLDISGAMDDWSVVDTIEIVYYNSEGKKVDTTQAPYTGYALTKVAPSDSIGADNTKQYKFDATHKLTMTTTCMNLLYEASIDGLTPTIEITVSEATHYNVSISGSKVSGSNTVTDYVTIATANLPKTVDDGLNLVIAKANLTATNDGAGGRSITGVKYTMGDDAEKKAASGDATNWTVSTVKGDVVLYPVTTEKVTLDTTSIGGDTGTNTAKIWNGTNTTVAAVNSAKNATSYLMTAAETMGEDYVFTVQAEANYAIDTVKATVKKADGSAVYKTYTLTVGDYGKCVLEGEKIIGATTIVVTTKSLSGTKYDVHLKDNAPDSQKVYDKTTKAEITKTGTNNLVTDGADYSFVIEPGNKYGVKSVKYTMGDVTDQALTGTYDKTTGNTSYTIENADSEIVLDIEYTNAVHFNKYATDKAVVEVNGEVLADDKQVVVPVEAGKNATVKATAADGSKVTGVYYINAENKATVTSDIASPLPSSFVKLGDAAGTYTVSESVMDSLAHASNSAFIVVTTETEVTDVTTKWTFGSEAGTAKAGTAHDSLTLYAGGTAANAFVSGLKGSAVTGIGTEVVTATFSKGGKAVAGTPTYTLGKTDSKTKIAEESTGTITTINTALPVDKTDVITAKLEDTTTNKLDKTVYTATLPLTVNTIADLADAQENYEFTLSDTVTEGGSYVTGAYDGTTSKTIRVYDSTAANDTATFVPKYGKTGTTPTTVASSNALVSGIRWATSPAYSSTKTSHDFIVYDIGETKNYINDTQTNSVLIKQAKTAGNIAVTATIDFIDGSTKDVTDTLTVAPVNYGYFAIPTTTVGASEVYNGLTVNLETKTNGTTNGTVAYTVYKIDDAGFFADLQTKTSTSTTLQAAISDTDCDKDLIDDYVEAEMISVVSTGVTYGAMTETDTNDIFESTATNPYAISAKKVGTGASAVPGIKVGTTPVTAGSVTVNVYESIPGYKLTLRTSTAALTGTLKNPELTADSAWSKMSPISKQLDAGHKVEAYIYESVPAGTKLTLPSLEDFATATVDPKFGIAGYKITKNGGLPTYQTVGSDYNMPTGVTSGVVIEPVWAYKYDGGNVVLFDADTDTAVATATPIEIAAGSTKNFKIGVYELDLENFNTSAGTATYYSAAKDIVWPESGLTLDVTGTSNLELVQGEKGVVGVKAKDQTAQVQNVGVSYKEGETSYTVKNSTPATITSVPVKGVEGNEYALTVGTDNAVTLELGETKAIEAVWTLKDSETKIDFNDSKFARVEIESNSNENVAEAAAISYYAPDFKHHIAFEGKAVGTTNIKVNLIDNKGVKTPATVAVTVTAAKTKIVGTDSLGHVVADNEAWEVAYGVDDTLAITIDDGTGATPYVVADSVLSATDATADYYGDDYVAAKNPASGYSISSGKVTITSASKFYEGAVLVSFEKSTGDVFERIIPVKVYMPITLKAQTTANKAHFTLKNNGTAVADGKDITEKVVYSGAASYTVDLSKFTADWNFEGKELEFNGWSTSATASGSAIAGTSETTKGGYTYSNSPSLKAGYINTVAKGDVTGLTTYGTLYATFGEPSVTVNGLPESIVLSDEKVSVFDADTTKQVKGTDVEILTLNMTPPTSTTSVIVSAEDTDDIYVIIDGATDYTAAPANVGNSPVTVLSPSGTKTRTGKFTIYKKPGEVGTSKLTITAGSNKVEVPVYLNGVYLFKAATATTSAIYHYMENGADVESGVRTVEGEKIYIKDSAVVENGVVEISSGKYALVRNHELVTKVGKAQYEDKFYYVTEDGSLKTGGLFAGLITSGSYKDDTKKYFAAEDGVLAQSELKEVSGKTYYFDNECQMAVASATANTFEATKDGKYYVNAAGEVAIKGIFKFDGKDRLFRENGKIVAYTDADVKDGQIEIDGVIYEIDKDTNEAKIAKEFFYQGFEIVEWKWNSGSPTVTVKMIYKAEDGTDASETLTDLPATTTDGADVTMKTYKATATAKFVKKGETEKKTEEFTKKYDKDGKSDVLYNPSVEWTTKWASKWSKSEAIPTMKYKVTYTSKESGTQVTTEELTASMFPTSVATDATEVTFVASADLSAYYTDETGATAVDPAKIAKSTTSKTYKFSKGGESGSSGQDISGGAGTFEIEGLEEEYEYTGVSIKPAFKVVDNERGVTLAKTTDYTVKYGKNIEGSGTITVTGKGNYAGQGSAVSFTIVKPAVDEDTAAGAVKKVVLPKNVKYTYTGEPIYPATITVVTKGDGDIVYTLGDDGTYSTESTKSVVLTFSNNINKGKATVAAYGKDGKAVSAGYSIKAADITAVKDFAAESNATWGVKAEAVTITGTYGEAGIDLVQGEDFTVTYKAPNAGEKAGTAKLVGKNNFKGKIDVAYDVDALEITDENIIVTAYSNSKVKAVKVQVIDKQGNALGNKLYTYDIKDAEGNTLDKKAAVPEEISVVVKSSTTNATTSSDDGESVDVKVGTNIKSVKINVPKGFVKTYTGEAITLDEEDFEAGKISVGSLKYDDDFKIVGYKNNIKKGKMTVTVQGAGANSGIKTFVVKIVAKPIASATK